MSPILLKNGLLSLIILLHLELEALFMANPIQMKYISIKQIFKSDNVLIFLLLDRDKQLGDI